MREINVSEITDVVERLCIEANTHLPGDVKCAIETCRACEDSSFAQSVLDKIIENYRIADSENVPICQDTGYAVFFVEVGQEVYVEGNLTEAINEGVSNVVIMDGRVPHAILMELLTDEGAGTMVTR